MEISATIYLISILVMAVFVGYYVVWSVTPALHTPLMAVTNAISSVIIVGALIALGKSGLENTEANSLSRWLGFGAVILASVNIFGGFLVTQRMLAMYRKKDNYEPYICQIILRLFYISFQASYLLCLYEA